MRAGETCARSGLCHCPAMLHRRKTAPQTRIVHHETVRRRRARPYSRSANTMEDIIKAAVLGLVEGLTEYIPVSSTGHLLLMQHFFGFADEGPGNTFAVLIPSAATLPLLSIYSTRLVRTAPEAREVDRKERQDRAELDQHREGIAEPFVAEAEEMLH